MATSNDNLTDKLLSVWLDTATDQRKAVRGWFLRVLGIAVIVLRCYYMLRFAHVLLLARQRLPIAGHEAT